VRQAVWDLMQFWVDRGCDGFRVCILFHDHFSFHQYFDLTYSSQMDVINVISKVDGLPDAPIVNPKEEFQPASMYYANGYVNIIVPCR